MKFNALLAALALSCAAVPAIAGSYLDGWVAQAQVKLDQRLAQAGFVQGGQAVDLRLHIDGDGDLSDPQIVTSSGSTTLDAALVKALRRVHAGQAPAELSGRSLLFHLAVSPSQTASLPGPQRR
jgi:TonB family protein